MSSRSGKVSLPSLPWLVSINSIINLSKTGANLATSSFVHPKPHLQLHGPSCPFPPHGGSGRGERPSLPGSWRWWTCDEGSDAVQQKPAVTAMWACVTSGAEAHLLRKFVLICWLSCTFLDFRLHFSRWYPSLIENLHKNNRWKKSSLPFSLCSYACSHHQKMC